MDSQPNRQVKFKKIDGTEIQMEVPKDILIQDLRKLLASASGIEENMQRLIFKAQLVKDDTKLSDYVKEDGQTIHLIQKPSQAQIDNLPQSNTATQPPQNQNANNQNQFRIPGMPPGFMINIPPGSGFGQPPNLGNLLSGFPGIRVPSQPGNETNPRINIQVGGNLGGQRFNPDQLTANIMNLIGGPINQQNVPQQPQQPQQQQAQSQQQQPSQAQTSHNQLQAMQLPHQVLFRIGQICNHMNGPGSSFPGPPMPQLQVERNIVVLLGSYLTNLMLQLQRLLPIMNRAGDLMQRESLLVSQAERQLTQELANNLGKAFEDISRATGSVAHFYKTLQIGQNGSQATIQVQAFEPSFQAIINEVNSVRNIPIPSNQIPQQQQEEIKQSEQIQQDFSNKKDPIEDISSLIQKDDLIKLMMGNYQALNHIPKKVFEFFTEKKSEYNNSIEKYAQNFTKSILKQIHNDDIKQQLHEGFDPVIASEDIINEYIIQVVSKVLSSDQSQDFQTFLNQQKELLDKTIGKLVEDLQDGFVNGEEDFFKWVQSNLLSFNKSRIQLANPQMSQGLINMQTGQQLNMLKQAYKRYQDGKQQKCEPQPQQQIQQVQNQIQPVANNRVDQVMESQDQQLSQHEQMARQISQNLTNSFLQKFKSTIDTDMQRIKNSQEGGIDICSQNSLGRAYQSTCSFNKSKILPKVEEIKQKQDFMKDRQKQLSELLAENIVRDQIRKNLIMGGGYPQAKVEETLSQISKIPDELIEAYIKMQKTCIKFRIQNDDDFGKMLYEDSPVSPDAYDFLKKL